MGKKLATLLQADVARALRAAKQTGAPLVRITVGEVTIEIPLTDEHIDRMMSSGHLPAPLRKNPDPSWK